MRPHYWISGLAICTAFTIACSHTGARAGALTDDQLDRAVTAKLQLDPQLKTYGIGVNANAAESRVTLSGSVPTEEMRTRAVALAKEAYSPLVIRDQIDVKPRVVERWREVGRSAYTDQMAQLTRQRATEVGEKIGSGLDDAWIHTKIRTNLVGEGELPFAGVNVDVVDKVVTLRGTVESATAKDTAERVSKATNGVTQVHNRLVVKKNG